MIRFFDGFSHYATADLPKKYVTVDPTHIITTGGRFGDGALGASAIGTTGTELNVLKLGDVGLVGFHTQYPTIGTTATGYYEFFKIKLAGTPRLSFVIMDAANGNGTIRAVRGDSTGTVIGTSSAAAVVAGAQRHIEIRWYMNTSNGNLEVRSEGDTVLAFSGINSGALGWSTCAHFLTTGERRSHFYMCDNVGPRNAATFLGANTRVKTLYVTGNAETGIPGVMTGPRFVASSGQRFECIDETPHNGDVDYIYTRVAPSSDIFTVQPLGDVLGIYALSVGMFAKKVSSDASVLIAPMIDAVMFGSNQSPGLDYTWIQNTWDLNMITDELWTEADVDGAYYGVRRTS